MSTLKLSDILIKPLITEKVSIASEKYGTSCFKVHLKASKSQIREAIEKFYDVRVTGVRTLISPGRLRRTKNGYKKTMKTKKAYISLKDGQKIELFKGV